MKRIANHRGAYAIGQQGRRGFDVRRVVWGKLLASMERRDDEEIRQAVLMVVEKKTKPLASVTRTAYFRNSKDLAKGGGVMSTDREVADIKQRVKALEDRLDCPWWPIQTPKEADKAKETHMARPGSERELASFIVDRIRHTFDDPGLEVRLGSDRLARPLIEVRLDGEWRFSVRVENRDVSKGVE